ncbi:MAG: nucleoside deaminase, partial [Anaerolineae bacterium]
LSVPADGEIVAWDERRMVTRWWNRCPTLEACQALGLDTRVICRLAYHGPVQAFLSRIEPRLRFDRNYDALRPHTPYCEEILFLVE